METKIYKLMNKKTFEKEENEILEQVGRVLLHGGLVAFPTETVYGLGANALDEAAAKRTYEAKGRPSDNPLIVHIGEMEGLKKIVREIPAKAQKVAEAFWPGPLTMVFHKDPIVPYGTTGGLETVAVRMPDHPLACEIIRVGGGYISAPSANVSGRPSPTSALHVKEDLEGKIPVIIDGGQVEIGVESTILDMTVEPPMILRPGAITKEMVEEIIGPIGIDPVILDGGSKEPPKAPGMKYRHYAPKATLQVVLGKDMVACINKYAKEKKDQGYKVGVIGTQETIDNYECDLVKSIGNRADSSSIAHNLYKVLREFDEEEVDYIYSESFYGSGINEAIMNRLMKAAGHNIIDTDKI